MGKPRFRPQRVLRAADQLLETKRLSSRPPWYTSLERIPPSQILVRPIKQRPVSYEEEEALLRPGQRINPSRSRMAKELRRPKTWAELTSSEARQGRSGSRHELYKPKKILYPEDKLRAEFFGDHPWELARPRVILESGGNDSKNWDWSLGINQPGKQLDGER